MLPLASDSAAVDPAVGIALCAIACGVVSFVWAERSAFRNFGVTPGVGQIILGHKLEGMVGSLVLGHVRLWMHLRRLPSSTDRLR